MIIDIKLYFKVRIIFYKEIYLMKIDKFFRNKNKDIIIKFLIDWLNSRLIIFEEKIR